MNKGVIYLFIILITVNIRQITLLLLNENTYARELTFLFLNTDPITCLMGPAIIYYFFSLTKGKIEIDNKLLLFCIPALLVFINLLPFYGIPFNQKMNFISQVQSNGDVNHIPFPFLFLDLSLQRTLIAIFNLACQLYIVCCLIKIIQTNRPNVAFNKLMKSLLWILSISILIFAFIIFQYRLKLDFLPDSSNYFIQIKDICYLFTLFLPISFFVFPTWLYGVEINLNTPKTIFKKRESTDQSNIIQPIFTKSEDLDRILDFIKEEKPFLNYDFSIHDISGALKLPQIRVSNSFNNHLNIPFPTYRNMCRIEHFLSLYENNVYPNYSIEGLAKESGFQTKSSFYAAFKNVHNMTPLQYINQKLKE